MELGGEGVNSSIKNYPGRANYLGSTKRLKSLP